MGKIEQRTVVGWPNFSILAASSSTFKSQIPVMNEKVASAINSHRIESFLMALNHPTIA